MRSSRLEAVTRYLPIASFDPKMKALFGFSDLIAEMGTEDEPAASRATAAQRKRRASGSGRPVPTKRSTAAKAQPRRPRR